jgi:hypothetical protein
MALVAVMGLMAVSAAFAQTSTPEAQDTPSEQTTPPLEKGLGRGFGFGCFGMGGGTAAYDAVAAALNLTPTQLFERLHAGETLSEIAEAQGLDLQAVQDAVNAARTEQMRERIAQAVEDGAITQEQADWMLEGLENGYMGRGGFGMGRGHGMMGGLRGMRGPGRGAAPTTPATPSGTES